MINAKIENNSLNHISFRFFCISQGEKLTLPLISMDDYILVMLAPDSFRNMKKLENHLKIFIFFQRIWWNNYNPTLQLP